MLAISKFDFTQNANQASISTHNNRQQSHLIKTHSQPKRDTANFKGLPANFKVVIPNKLFIGIRPSVKEINALENKGIKSVVDVCNSSDETTISEETSKIEEIKKIEALGIEYVPGILNRGSNRDFVGQLEGLANNIDTQMKKGPVFIYCENGERCTVAAVVAYQHFIQKMPDSEILKYAQKSNNEALTQALLFSIKSAVKDYTKKKT